MTQKKRKKYIIAMSLLAFVMLLGSPTLADTMIDNCSVLNVTGETYLLSADIMNLVSVNINYCFVIESENITLDCQNHIIDASSLSDANLNTIININANSKAKIKNCNLRNFDNFCIYSDSYYANITNNTLINCTKPIYIFYDNYVSFNNIINSSTGIDVEGDNSIINNNYFEYNNISIDVEYDYTKIFSNNIKNSFQYGIYDYPSNQGTLFYNNTFNNSINVFINGEYNEIWNTTLGNYWTNSTFNDWSDTCNCTDGICDEPYILNENNIDYLPLCTAEAEPEPTPTPNPLENLTVAYTYCLTNNTLALINHTNEYGNITTSYQNCPNGCDNTTTSCNPPKWQSNLIILIIVSLVIIGLYKLYRWI